VLFLASKHCADGVVVPDLRKARRALVQAKEGHPHE
jgi:hypothetical protein